MYMKAKTILNAREDSDANKYVLGRDIVVGKSAYWK